MTPKTAIADGLEKAGMNTLAVELDDLCLKALARNGQNPEKAKHTLLKLMLDTPRVFVELFGGKEAVLEKGYQRLCGFKRRHDEAKAAAERNEARAGQSGSADKASNELPAASRRNDGESGQSPPAAKSGHTISAASPSSQNRDGGQNSRADNGRIGIAASRSLLGKREGQSRTADKAIVAVPSPSPSNRSGAGHSTSASHGHSEVARPASIPVKMERVHHGASNESAADIAAKMQVARERGALLAPTFQIFDGNGRKRDMAEVYGHEMAGIHQRNVETLHRQGHTIREHLVNTIAHREIWARVGNSRKRADAVLPRTEIIAIRNRADLHVAAMSEVALESLAAEVRKMERGGRARIDNSAVPMFQETIKLIGGTANAA